MQRPAKAATSCIESGVFTPVLALSCAAARKLITRNVGDPDATTARKNRVTISHSNHSRFSDILLVFILSES